MFANLELCTPHHPLSRGHNHTAVAKCGLLPYFQQNTQSKLMLSRHVSEKKSLTV